MRGRYLVVALALAALAAAPLNALVVPACASGEARHACCCGTDDACSCRPAPAKPTQPDPAATSIRAVGFEQATLSVAAAPLRMVDVQAMIGWTPAWDIPSGPVPLFVTNCSFRC